jgi:hypothetical protein
MTVSRSRLIWEDTVRNTECKKVERMASVRALLTRRWKFGFHSRNEASVPTDYLSDRKALHPWLSMLISSFYSKKWWSTMWHSWWYDHDLFESVEMEMLLLTELCEQLFVSLFLEWNVYSTWRKRDTSFRLQRELWSRQIQISLLLLKIKLKVNTWNIQFLLNCCWIQYRTQSMMHDIDNLLSAWFHMNAHKFNTSPVYVMYHCAHRSSLVCVDNNEVWILIFQIKINLQATTFWTVGC